MDDKPLTFVLSERCIDLDAFFTLMFFRKPDKSGSFDKKLRIVKQYPQLESFDNVPPESQDYFVKEEISKIHAQHKSDLMKALKDSERLWSKVENRFQTAVTSVFPDLPWPEGDYKCYLSVLDINAIIKAEKSFQLFYEMVLRGITNTVIAHELLHFMFYSYIERFPEIDKIKLWEMAEVFNKFIQSTQKFTSFNYPADKVLEEKQENILKDIKANMNPETVNIQDFVSYYQTRYLS